MSTLPLQPSASLRVYDDILETIGRTPLVRLQRLGRDLACPLYAKIEAFNPGGSVKDRIAVNIIEQAERSGSLQPGGTVVEATSGNTGLGLAMVCAQKGYRSVFVMPDKMSQEKIQLLRAFGARVVITPTAVAPEDPRSYYNVARKIVDDTPNAVLANQYHNPENPRSHYQTTGPEIWEQTGGKVDGFICAVGTGGTLAGVAAALRERNPDIAIGIADPPGAALYSYYTKGVLESSGSSVTEGIGQSRITANLEGLSVDAAFQIPDAESATVAFDLLEHEGLCVGLSSGVNVAGAMRLARQLGPGHVVVTVLADYGTRYASRLFNPEFLRAKGLPVPAWLERGKTMEPALV